MTFYVITIFPDLIRAYLSMGIVSRALQQGLLSVEILDLRDYSDNRYRKIDSPVYGHGRGMLFRAPPLKQAIEVVKSKAPNCRVVTLTPQGRVFDQKTARRFASEKDLLLLAARYEGIDARIIKLYSDEQISIGNYVVTGGELPALMIIDAVSRFLPGTIQPESLEQESFENGLVEYDHYTEPIDFEGITVPEVLRSGDHSAIADFRYFSSLRNTYYNRPDLLRDYVFPDLESATKDELKRLQRKNKNYQKYNNSLKNICKEWKNARRKCQ